LTHATPAAAAEPTVTNNPHQFSTNQVIFTSTSLGRFWRKKYPLYQQTKREKMSRSSKIESDSFCIFIQKCTSQVQ
jgi:hypothetical protein